MKDKQVLIVWHSRTGASKALAAAAAEGAGVGACLMRAEDVEPTNFLRCGAYIFVCPENLAAMSGMMKDMFDRCYYPVLGKIEGRAYATIIAAGSDGTNAQHQIDRIAKGWRLKRVAEPMIVNLDAQKAEKILAPKLVHEAQIIKSSKLGAALFHGLDLGLF